MISNDIRLFFHSPCFDGAVSAALTCGYLERADGLVPSRLIGVNYHLKDTWLSDQPTKPCAIVDLLYQTRADFWADHHSTTLLTEAARKDFEIRGNNNLLYDSS